MPAPATSSRHLYTEHRRGHIQKAPRLRAHRSGPLSQDHPQIPHSDDENAKPLWEYFQTVIAWIERTFTERRPKIMRSVDWGSLYDDHKDAALDPVAIEKQVARLITDDEVKNQKGIYPYVLTGEERHLNLRTFANNVKQRVYEDQDGKCAECGTAFDLSKMEADHITPWSEGGKTIEENCQMLCKEHNRRKAAR